MSEKECINKYQRIAYLKLCLGNKWQSAEGFLDNLQYKGKWSREEVRKIALIDMCFKSWNKTQRKYAARLK